MHHIKQIGCVLVLLIPILFVSQSFGETKCQQTFQGVKCISQVDFQKFAQIARKSSQQQSQWCWAACISMLFKHYGHPVSQARIVSDAYGTIANIPAQSGFVIAKQLNRNWKDDSGKNFKARVTGAFDFDAGVININNAWVINELHNDRPFIIGTGSHAVVGTAIEYFRTPTGPWVTQVGVFDPWPGVGARGLSPAEFTPIQGGGVLRFIATVNVSK